MALFAMRRSFRPCNIIITTITTTAQWLLSATGTTIIITTITTIDDNGPAPAGLFLAAQQGPPRTSRHSALPNPSHRDQLVAAGPDDRYPRKPVPLARSGAHRLVGRSFWRWRVDFISAPSPAGVAPSPNQTSTAERNYTPVLRTSLAALLGQARMYGSQRSANFYAEREWLIMGTLREKR